MESAKKYKPGEFARLVNVTYQTLDRWDREGKLVAERNQTNGRRYYTDKHVRQVLGNTNTEGQVVFRKII